MKWLWSFFTGGALSRILDTVDGKIDAGVERDRIKGDIVQEYYRTRADWMRAGGFWLMVGFAIPVMFWAGAVFIYSVFWCAGCAYPQPWSIGAVPPPFDEWAGLMIMSIFGVIGLNGIRK